MNTEGHQFSMLSIEAKGRYIEIAGWLGGQNIWQMNLPSCWIIMTNNQVNGISK